MAAAEQPISVKEASGQTALPEPTVSRLMRALASEGLLARDERTGGYRLGYRLFVVAQSALTDSLLSGAAPIMARLRDLTGETVTLNVRVGDNRVCIAQVESREVVRRVVQLGFSLPLHLGATGEVFMAWSDEPGSVEYFDRMGMDEGELEFLKERLNRIREVGWALQTGTVVPDLSGIAAPVLDGSRASAVLTVAGPRSR